MQTDTHIRIFDFQMSEEDKAVVHKFVNQVLSEGYLTNHSLVEKLELDFQLWTQAKFNLAVNNGSSALLAAFSILQKKSQRTKILLPTNTFIACWSSIVQNGYEPILIESNSSFLGFDLNHIEEHLKKGDVAAVLAVHIGGIIDSEFMKLKQLCADHGVVLIEDAAHAHGSHLNGKNAGSLGDMATFSFHLTKAITGGEGGLISTNNSEFYEELISVRQFGKSKTNPHLFERMGGNYKMSEMQAALLLADLERAQKRISRRKEIAAFYFEELKSTPLKILKPSEGSDSSYYKCIGILSKDTRADLLNELQKNNIQMPNGVYYWPLHKQPIVNQREANFPNADFFANQHICLPCYPELTNEQLKYFIDVFQRCVHAGLV